MQLLLPIRSIEQATFYLEDGIREFYCGYISKEWIATFNKQHEQRWTTLQVSMNRRDYLTSNLTDLQELKEIANLCNAYQATLFVTLNAAFYAPIAYPYLEKWLQELSQIGIQHLIVSDIGMMQLIAKHYPNFKITVSCENQVLNADAVTFYRQFQPERIVFPRHITISEITPILAENPDIEFECFLLSSRCVFDDGNCRCIHDIEPICNEAWITKFFRTDGKNVSFSENRALKNANQDMTDWIYGIEQSTNQGFGCGKVLCSICSVSNLSQYPNFTSLKVVGRGMRFPKQALDGMKYVIELSKSHATLSDYQEFAQKFFCCDTLCSSMASCNMRGAQK